MYRNYYSLEFSFSAKGYNSYCSIHVLHDGKCSSLCYVQCALCICTVYVQCMLICVCVVINQSCSSYNKPLLPGQTIHFVTPVSCIGTSCMQFWPYKFATPFTNKFAVKELVIRYTLHYMYKGSTVHV